MAALIWVAYKCFMHPLRSWTLALVETEKPIHTPVDTPLIETVRACPAGEQCTVDKVRMGSLCKPIALFKSVINEVIE